jgi:hypothetical protein
MLTQQDIQLLKDLLLERIQQNLIKNINDIDSLRIHRLTSSKETLGRVEETLHQLRETNSDVTIRAHRPNSPSTANDPMTVSRLAYKDVSGSGKHIYARVNSNVNCVEFTLGAGFQRILDCDAILGYEPWVQFEPKERDVMMERTFIEMVDAWNEKYGQESEE